MKARCVTCVLLLFQRCRGSFLTRATEEKECVSKDCTQLPIIISEVGCFRHKGLTLLLMTENASIQFQQLANVSI